MMRLLPYPLSRRLASALFAAVVTLGGGGLGLGEYLALGGHVLFVPQV